MLSQAVRWTLLTLLIPCGTLSAAVDGRTVPLTSSGQQESEPHRAPSLKGSVRDGLYTAARKSVPVAANLGAALAITNLAHAGAANELALRHLGESFNEAFPASIKKIPCILTWGGIYGLSYVASGVDSELPASFQLHLGFTLSATLRAMYNEYWKEFTNKNRHTIANPPRRTSDETLTLDTTPPHAPVEPEHPLAAAPAPATPEKLSRSSSAEGMHTPDLSDSASHGSAHSDDSPATVKETLLTPSLVATPSRTTPPSVSSEVALDTHHNQTPGIASVARRLFDDEATGEDAHAEAAAAPSDTNRTLIAEDAEGDDCIPTMADAMRSMGSAAYTGAAWVGARLWRGTTKAFNAARTAYNGAQQRASDCLDTEMKGYRPFRYITRGIMQGGPAFVLSTFLPGSPPALFLQKDFADYLAELLSDVKAVPRTARLVVLGAAGTGFYFLDRYLKDEEITMGGATVQTAGTSVCALVALEELKSGFVQWRSERAERQRAASVELQTLPITEPTADEASAPPSRAERFKAGLREYGPGIAKATGAATAAVSVAVLAGGTNPLPLSQEIKDEVASKAAALRIFTVETASNSAKDASKKVRAILVVPASAGSAALLAWGAGKLPEGGSQVATNTLANILIMLAVYAGSDTLQTWANGGTKQPQEGAPADTAPSSVTIEVLPDEEMGETENRAAAVNIFPTFPDLEGDPAHAAGAGATGKPVIC